MLRVTTWRHRFTRTATFAADGTESTVDAFDGVATATDPRMNELGGGESVDVAVGGFDSFFATHHAVVVRALTLALGDEQLGRDAAAEGFTRALQRWSRISSYDNPTGWIYRVGLNWARSRRRKTMREIAESGAVDLREATAHESHADPQVVSALLQLSPDHRAVVVGRYYLDWSEREIADALGIRPGTVKSRLSRALAKLADDLGTA
jgi:RNA polymerase sigma-70 factor, ECF subfamily